MTINKYYARAVIAACTLTLFTLLAMSIVPVNDTRPVDGSAYYGWPFEYKTQGSGFCPPSIECDSAVSSSKLFWLNGLVFFIFWFIIIFLLRNIFAWLFVRTSKKIEPNSSKQAK